MNFINDMEKFNLIENEDITNFVSLAAEYCTFVENTNNFIKRDFIKKSIDLFSELYQASLKLPRIQDDEWSTPEKFVSEMEWNSIYEKVRSKIGYHDDYLDVYDPVSKEEGDVSIASLADNFADIYQDLKNFSVSYGFGNEDLMEEALWELIYNFEEYWGLKLLNGLRILHRVFFSDEDLEDEDNPREDEENVNRNWLFEEKRDQSKDEGNEV